MGVTRHTKLKLKLPNLNTEKKVNHNQGRSCSNIQAMYQSNLQINTPSLNVVCRREATTLILENQNLWVSSIEKHLYPQSNTPSL